MWLGCVIWRQRKNDGETDPNDPTLRDAIQQPTNTGLCQQRAVQILPNTPPTPPALGSTVVLRPLHDGGGETDFADCAVYISVVGRRKARKERKGWTRQWWGQDIFGEWVGSGRVRDGGMESGENSAWVEEML